ncbi:hypothetical protein BH11BAC2_BH11BAC2_23240 [soil metagenome]
MANKLIEKKAANEKRAALNDKDVIKSVFIDDFFSAGLKHTVNLEILLPPWYAETPQFSFPVLYLNDGQNMRELKLKESLLDAYLRNQIPPMIVVGIYASNRMQEYGIAGVPDFKKRGAKADKYSRFVVNELLPLISKNFRISQEPAHTAIAGFSLGGLSAFDIAWNYPHIFGGAGIFSGSFWWRSKGYTQGYDNERDRIMHKLIRGTDSKSNQRFWFQCGTNDELADRNNNGVIDSIEDTLDLISELEELGFKRGKDVAYVEVEGGRHNEETWAAVLPNYLKFAFGE